MYSFFSLGGLIFEGGTKFCRGDQILHKKSNLQKLVHPDQFLQNTLTEDDWRFSFLNLISKWLDRWRSTNDKDGKLSPQTFVSFRHSCITLPLIVSHLIKNCDFSYVLSSRLQNDPIEHQFGLYRMMSGAQYHISYT